MIHTSKGLFATASLLFGGRSLKDKGKGNGLLFE
jgi:hypothetical protein